LQSFIAHDLCKDIPIILEAPVLETEDAEKILIQKVHKWIK
jgi:endonuclease IV